MKTALKRVLIALWLTVIMPWILLQILIKQDVTENRSAVSETESVPPTEFVDTICVLQSDGTTTEMNLKDYITGVVLAEMPATFDIEALKAQAVVARTYALKRSQRGDKHSLGAVCTDSTCCQAFVKTQDYISRGGSMNHLEKVSLAVTNTHPQVLIYDGELIEATFFACSGGSTEDAVAVWGEDVPYLHATDSPGEEGAEVYTNTVRYSLADFGEKLDLDIKKLVGNFIGPVTYTRGGGVETIAIADCVFTGVQMRQYLNLNSTAFYITAIADTVTITTRGHGHRVGMSQYGADAMAASGHSYREILSHYYQGTALVG